MLYFIIIYAVLAKSFVVKRITRVGYPRNLKLFRGRQGAIYPMGILNINDIQAGMVLEECVVNFQGTTLIDAGIALTEKHLMALKAWGVTEAKIVGISPTSLEEKGPDLIDEETKGLIERELANLFQKTNMEDPLIVEIYRLVKKRKIHSL